MTKSTKIFYALIITVCLLQLFKFISPKIFLNQFHLKSSNYPAWSAMQFIPSMYNYSNSAWLSPYKVDDIAFEDIKNRDLEHVKMQLNHYPARVITFRKDRDTLSGGKLNSIYIRSEFAGETIITAYEWNKVNNTFHVIMKKTYAGE